MNVQKIAQKIVKWLVIAALVALLGSCVWSFIFETLIPDLKYGYYVPLLLDVAFVVLILASLPLMIHGAVLLYIGAAALDESVEYKQAGYIIQDETASPEEVRQARRLIFSLLWKAWKPGLKWFIPGVALLALGAWVGNLH